MLWAIGLSLCLQDRTHALGYLGYLSACLQDRLHAPKCLGWGVIFPAKDGTSTPVALSFGVGLLKGKWV